jgi:hypothetical protein
MDRVSTRIKLVQGKGDTSNSTDIDVCIQTGLGISRHETFLKNRKFSIKTDTPLFDIVLYYC